VIMWVQTSFSSELGLVMRREGDLGWNSRIWEGKSRFWRVRKGKERKGKERKGLGEGLGEGECLLFSCSAEPLGTWDCGHAISFVSILLRIVLTFRTALLNR
jgi:hypothetical protein